jgi:hypothetical protein
MSHRGILLSITHKFAAQRGTEGEAGEMSEAEPHHYIAGCGVSGASHIATKSGNLHYIIRQGAWRWLCAGFVGAEAIE